MKPQVFSPVSVTRLAKAAGIGRQAAGDWLKRRQVSTRTAELCRTALEEEFGVPVLRCSEEEFSE